MACTCKLVGSLDIGYRGVQSIDVNHRRSTVVYPSEDLDLGVMPVVTTITMVAYPREIAFRPTTCPVSLNATFRWTTIYDCDVDKMFYIYNRIADIHYSGELPPFIQTHNSTSVGTSIHASAASGPYTPYFENEAYIATDMTYTGNPIHFNTRVSKGFSGLIEVMGYKVVLKSFSYTHNDLTELVTFVFEGGSHADVMLPVGDGGDDSC